jgi:hypothetical protein
MLILKKLGSRAEGTDCTLAARLALAVCLLGEDESVTCGVNANTPVDVEVPETTPALDRVTPLGRVPALIVQV